MIQFLKNSYRYFKKKNTFFWSVNWLKTYYFNFKMFPYAIARKLPVYFYGKVKLSSLKGTITIEAPIKKAMIGFGQRYELVSQSKKQRNWFLTEPSRLRDTFNLVLIILCM